MQFMPAVDRLEVWGAAQRGRFSLWLPVIMTAGSVAYFSWGSEPWQWLGATVCLLAGVAGWCVRHWQIPRSAAAAAFALGLGFASGQWATARAPELLEVPRTAVVVTGMVRAVEALPQGRRVTLQSPTLTTALGTTPPANRLVRIRLRTSDALPVAAGDMLRVRAMLSRPAPPAYPGAWDLQRDAFFFGMGAYGFALNPAQHLADAEAPGGLAALLQRVRETVAGRVSAVLQGPQAAVAITLLTGGASSLDAADKSAFRDSGLSHLLAIAGLHIGIVMGLVFGAVRLGLAAWERAALRLPVKAIASVAALAAGGGYMLLTGAHVPIVRSFAMACLFTLAVLAQRRALSLRGLATAMAAVVLLSPHEVMGVSFQMSFSAVLALIAGYALLRPWLRRLHGEGGLGRRVLGHVVGLAITSALAGTASAPFGAYHFGHIQLYFVLANMAAVPLTAFWVMPLGLLALLLMPLHLEAAALVPMGWGEVAILWIGQSVSALPDATLAVPHVASWGLALVALGIAWLGLWRGRVRLAGLALVAAGLASPMVAPPPDLMVSADARMIGLRTEDGLFLQARSGASGFTRDAWQQMWDSGPLRPLPDLAADALPIVPISVSCSARTCRLQGRAHGAVALLLRSPMASGSDPDACAAAVVVVAEPLRLRCASRVPVVDRFSVWREGAYAIWLDADGVRIVSELSVRGVRPWAPSPTRRAMPAGLTPALADTLPALAE